MCCCSPRVSSAFGDVPCWAFFVNAVLRGGGLTLLFVVTRISCTRGSSSERAGVPGG